MTSFCVLFFKHLRTILRSMNYIASVAWYSFVNESLSTEWKWDWKLKNWWKKKRQGRFVRLVSWALKIFSEKTNAFLIRGKRRSRSFSNRLYVGNQVRWAWRWILTAIHCVSFSGLRSGNIPARGFMFV